jgi:hypothetical protein
MSDQSDQPAPGSQQEAKATLAGAGGLNAEPGEMGRKLLDQGAALIRQVEDVMNVLRVDIMDRLDRLQDAQTKQRMDLDTMVDLLSQSAPATLLARIRHLEDEVRELKEKKA